MKKLFLVAIIALLSATATDLVAQNKKTQKWFAAQEWLQGAKFTPATSIDVEEFAAHYKKHPNRWNKIFSILADENLITMPLGLQEINENIKMNVQEYQTRPTVGKNVLLEKHSKYIDVQCVVVGEELHGTRKIEFGEVVKPYVDQRDIAMYDVKNVPYYIIHSGEFTIFFPDDLHTTNYGFGERTQVRKIVFKVKYD